MSAITTHVLDTARGLPAAGVRVRLERLSGAPGGWEEVGAARTDADGRAGALAPPAVAAGRYRLTFDTGGYFEENVQPSFFPEVAVQFVVDGSAGHWHVPLLLNPYGYSTYRGS